MSELKKVLSFRVILLITINSIMGTGIFFLPAVGAGVAGTASILSWLILSAIAIYIGMVFAELSSMFPEAGGIYEFSKQAFGRFWSFIIGWATLIAGNITIAMLVVGAIQYLLPFHLPWVQIPLSLFFILLFNFIAYRGMKTSATMLVAFGIITMGTLFSLIIPGLFKLNLESFTPFFTGGPSTIIIAIFFIAETFFGWETATFLAAETKDGAKVMPKALIWGTIIIAIICMLSVITAFSTIAPAEYSIQKAPLSALGMAHYGGLGGDIFTILVYVSIIGSVAGWIVSAPRLILAMAQDELFLKSMAKIHPKYNTPYKAIMFQTIITIILVFAGSGSYTTLVELLVPMVLAMYAAVMVSLVVLRYKQPKTKRYYRAPAGTWGPLVIVAFLMFLLYMWVTHSHGAAQIFGLGLSFILIGIPVYGLLEMYYNPKTIRIVNDFFASVAYYTEWFNIPKKVRNEILLLLRAKKGDTLLEYGCSVGTLTLLLAEAVGPKGKIYATDISKREIAIAEHRLEKEGHKHVKIFHTPIYHNIHPEIPKVDAVVSVAALGYTTDVGQVLKHLNKRLEKGAKILFVDYDKFFDIIPNIEWLQDDVHIVKTFKKYGFEVSVTRKQGFAWQYVYILGKKTKNYR